MKKYLVFVIIKYFILYKMKYYFSIGACFKNEHHCIKEWIEHYKLHGVDHIYLINDFSTPEYEPIIQPYIDEGFVTLYHNDIIMKYLEDKI